jgi:hypothetical protein
MHIVKLVRLRREQRFRLIAGSHESEQASAAMYQKNILPYNGLAYLIDDAEGEFRMAKSHGMSCRKHPMADRNRTPCSAGICLFRG